MTFIETMGGYLLARYSIRTAADFRLMVSVLFTIVIILLPFAAYEAYTGQNLILKIFSYIAPVFMDYSMRPRWGLRRVQAVFEHPILFGVACSSVFGLTHLVLGYKARPSVRWIRTCLVGLTTFFSFSSGPISAMTIQALLIFWDWALRKVEIRWKILVGIFASMYVAVALLSNQSVLEFYIHYFAFSQDTGWDRLFIWQYGSASVVEHPLFGIGYNEYKRPEWMEPSIDMFWLINAVRFGIPAGFLIMVAFLSTVISVARSKGLDEMQSTYRTAFLISMTGFFVVGWTVHFWNSLYILFLFLLGSGVWILDAGTHKVSSPDRTAVSNRRAAATPASTRLPRSKDSRSLATIRGQSRDRSVRKVV
jgi:hypothetical protein